MSLASSEDVVALLGLDLTPEQAEQIEGLLEEASDLVLAWCRPYGMVFDPIPAAVARVTARVVARVITSGSQVDGTAAQTTVVGPFQRQVTFNADATSGGPWLTRADKLRLKPHRNSYVQHFETY